MTLPGLRFRKIGTDLETSELGVTAVPKFGVDTLKLHVTGPHPHKFPPGTLRWGPKSCIFKPALWVILKQMGLGARSKKHNH